MSARRREPAMSIEAHAAILTTVVVTSFATLVTTHLSIALRVASEDRRALALACILVPPLAPYAAFRSGRTVRASIWVGALAVYSISLILAW